ncbi:MAG: matrixin family metalloprotease [Planctomycetota bacterium]
MIWETAFDLWHQISNLGAEPTSRTRSRRRLIVTESVEVVPCEMLEARSLPSALSIVIDYRFDTNNFFDTQEKRDLFQQVANMYAARITDNLSAISPSGTNTWSAAFTDPATGQQATVNNLYVGADTIVVFAGGRDLEGNTLGIGGPGGYNATGSKSWLATVDHRGQSGATGNNPTDFGPWGGSITFDTVGTNWHFGATTEGLDSNETDFMSVAMHELGHILGFGTSESFDNLVSGGKFTGPKAVAEYDGQGNPPLNQDFSHWADGTTDGGQETAMDPAIMLGTRKLFTNLDWAALDDLGWTLTSTNPAPAPTITMAGQIPTFVRGGLRVILDPSATFGNSGGLPVKGSQLQVSTIGNQGKYDAVTIATGNGITKSGATLKYNGVSIGTYSNGFGTKAFKLTFSSKATDEAVQACLRNLQFYTTSQQAGTLDRTLSIRILNMNGQNSAPAFKTVHVAAGSIT